jgi:DNA-binding protein YbaB
MFDKLKQLKELKGLQNEIKKESYDIDHHGVRLVMNGGMELQEVHLSPDLQQEQQEQALVQAHNDLLRKVQMAMAQRFRGMM